MDHTQDVLSSLAQMIEAETSPPAVVVFAPDQADKVIGNKAGFLHLAVAAIKAANGETQDFEGESWVHQNDVDWQINGFEHDAYAHLYLPKKRTKLQEFLGTTIPGLILLFVIICIVVGLKTMWHSLFH